MDELIKSIENLSLKDTKALLCNFTKQSEKNVICPTLQDNVRVKFWSSLFKHIDEDESVKLLCLKTIRILSREKLNLKAYISEDRLKKIIDISNISQDSDSKDDCSIEALKCLCNITYNLPSVADLLNNFDVTILLARRLSNSKGRKDMLERKLSEIKLLFLITAFSHPARHLLYNKYSLSFFTDICIEEGKIPKDNFVSAKRKRVTFGSDQICILCEILKTVFNVLCNLKSDEIDNKEEFKEFVSVLRELTLVGLNSTTDVLLRDIVNVLTLIPAEFLECLMIPGQKYSEKNVEKCPSMEAISVLIDFLDSTLVKIEEVIGTPKEELSPVLLVLTTLSKSNKQCRKYIRSRVLPNLKEIYTRPEVGNTLRNKLCRLLTCPLTSTRDLVADFLFILCKESVGRMVKYTGYGNAAGLLAKKGLLAGNVNPRLSSESEDSETEEYSQHKHMINPVVGCLTPPRTDETKDMTEEQKEYLAIELANKIDKLQREGIFTPCRIGPDGKPVPVEHVLELQENPPSPITKN